MLTKKTGFALFAVFLLTISSLVHASFVIRDIRVEGLQRISVGTVFNAIPYEIGDRVGNDAGSDIIRSLYKTGFFKDVALEQDGGILVVSVIERPLISKVSITGNKDIDTDKLKEGLRDAGMTEGRVYNELVLDKVKEDLKRSYFDRGKYGMIISSTVSPLERNRVNLDINIREGRTAKIRRINIIGNKAYKEGDVLDEMSLSKSGIFSRFTKNDQYSRQKMQADLESIRSFYMDRGHLKFDVESTQVNINPEKEDVYLTINIKEGDVYTLRDIKLAGKTVLDPQELFPLIELRRGEPFSRKDVVESAERISNALSEQGYALASVNPIPDVDEDGKTVAVTFYVEPGKRVYVRNINISGNTRSRDRVLRREFRQMEAAWFSAEKVRQSKERLMRLGYFNTVDVVTKPVPGAPDQVDVEVTVDEKRSRELLLGVGFSQSGGLSFQAKLSDDNFFGTGKRITAGFNTSDVNTYYELTYTNPYFTVDGISQGFTLKYSETDLSQLDTDSTATYGTNTGVIGVNFGFPVTEYDRIGVFLNAEFIEVNQGPNPIPGVTDVYPDGQNFINYKLGLTWAHDNRDKAFFPTTGSQINVGLTIALPGGDQTFATISYKHKQYFNVVDDMTVALRGEVAYGWTYGDTNLYPFFENFYAGGPSSVRGYQSYSLGPRANDSQVPAVSRAIGGQFKVTGSAELWFPPPFLETNESLRMFGFVDGGQVYRNYSAFDTDGLRYSAGVGVSWLSPFGLLNLSYALPINDKPGDDLEAFQFTFGTNF